MEPKDRWTALTTPCFAASMYSTWTGEPPPKRPRIPGSAFSAFRGGLSSVRGPPPSPSPLGPISPLASPTRAYDLQRQSNSLEYGEEEEIGPNAEVTQYEERLHQQALEMAELRAKVVALTKEREVLASRAGAREAELRAVRDEVVALQRTHAAQTLRAEEAQVALRSDVSKKEAEVVRLQRRAASQEAAAASGSQGEERLRAELQALERAHRDQRTQWEGETTALRREVVRITEERVRVGREAEAAQKEAQRRVSAKEEEVRGLRAALDLALAEGADARKEAEAALSSTRKRAREEEVAPPRGMTEGEAHELQVLRQERDQWRRTGAERDRLEREVRELRQQGGLQGVLSEQVTLLSGRVQAQELALAHRAQEVAELEELRQAHRQLELTLGELADVASPAQIRARLAALQSEVALHLAARTEAEQAREAAQSRAEEQVGVAQRAQAAQQQAEATLRATQDQLRVEQHQSTLLHRDVEALKAMLSAYDAAEETASPGAALVSFERGNRERVRLLEQQLAERQAEVARLQGELAEGVQRRQEEEAQLEDLARRVSAGEHNPRTTKVLHLQDNPMRRARDALHSAAIAALTEERDALKEQLQALHAEGGPGETVPAHALETLQSERRERATLEAQLERLTKEAREVERSRRRFQEVFARKFGEFKRVVCKLFGFRIELLGEQGDHYRLQPEVGVVAEKDAHFLVQYKAREDALGLLDTPYARHWQDDLAHFLGGQGSYPLFFARVITSLGGGDGNDEGGED